MERRRYQEHPPRDEYVLTEKGCDLFPIIAAMLAWAIDGRPARPARRCCSSTNRAAGPGR